MGALNNALSNAQKVLTNATQSLLGNATGLATGTNPLVQPQIVQIAGVNLPATPLISSRDYFLTQLNSWFSAPSLVSQWICVIDMFPPALNSSILRNLERTAGNYNAFDINVAKSLLTSFPMQRVAGCIFANSVQIPSEELSVEAVTVKNNRGYIPGIISNNRADYSSGIQLGFYESNTSFVDMVLRPWVMLASHYGFVTRKDPKYRIKCNITMLFYAKTFQNVSMIPRKVFRFFNCIPTQVSQQNYDYSEKSEVTSFDVRFNFTNYTVENNLYLPLPQIIAAAKTQSVPALQKIVPFLS
jgi:hypothetical protein